MPSPPRDALLAYQEQQIAERDARIAALEAELKRQPGK